MDVSSSTEWPNPACPKVMHLSCHSAYCNARWWEPLRVPRQPSPFDRSSAPFPAAKAREVTPCQLFYSKPSLYSGVGSTPWGMNSNSGVRIGVISAAMMENGPILCIGADNQLYTQTNPA